MRQQEIIEKVEGATPWLSSLVVIPKKCGDVRLIVDMKKANTPLIRSKSNILLRTLVKRVNILHLLRLFSTKQNSARGTEFFIVFLCLGAHRQRKIALCA